MSDSAAVKIPPYNFSDPALWFLMCESTFKLGVPKPVTESVTKFNYVVAFLPPEAASIVRDVIAKPDEDDPYSQIKKELIKRSGESSQQEIRKLLAGEQLGDRKPSELLRIMKRRAESYSIPNELMLELFLQHLPSSVQSILAAITPLQLDKAAEIADRIIEVHNPISVSAVSSSIPTNSFEEKLMFEIDKLNQRIDKLYRSRSVSRNRDKSKYRNKSVNRNSNYCWYHTKFAEKAVKCVDPCNFKKNETG